MNELLSMITEIFDRESMSNAALGLYAQMADTPRKDYVSFEQICSFNASEPKEIKETLNELINHKFLIHPDDNDEIYAINKRKLSVGIKEVIEISEGNV